LQEVAYSASPSLWGESRRRGSAATPGELAGGPSATEPGATERARGARAQVRARGVEAMVAAMARLRGHAMVQLSALLAFIPLALENAALQAHVAALALREVLAAMAAHRRVANVQAKGLIVLGVLGQARRRALDALGPHCPRTLCG